MARRPHQELIANRRRLTEIVAQMERISQQAAALLLPEGGAKTGKKVSI